MTTDLEHLHFTNRFTSDLPGDPETAVQSRAVTHAAFSRVDPTPVPDPTVIAFSREVVDLLELDPAEPLTPRFARVFSGNESVDGMDPFAACYGGHQFGNWAGQLGDGRAIGLGEIETSNGDHWTLQLKGAGPTPYSRRADGRAVLRSSVREFLCSEAMFHLGVPTTRALSLTLTGDSVTRDMFYDGRVASEPGAIVTRVSPSFTRFGTFELPAHRGDLTLLRQLVDHTLRTDFPHLLGDENPGPVEYAQFFAEVVASTAELMVHWMRVGFVHGVMNTDNMSILGLTIDYGPYGWLENYDPTWTPNTTDAGTRRYRYGQQPAVAHWNLVQLANALAPLMDGEVQPLQEAIDAYPDLYRSGWHQAFANKLGLESFEPALGDSALIEDLGELLHSVETDMTIFFRQLAVLGASDADEAPAVPEALLPAYYRPEELDSAYRERLESWLARYRTRLDHDSRDPDERRLQMDAVNPIYVLRNWLAQEAIDSSTAGDHSGITALLDVLRNPYTERPGLEHFAEKRPEWARNRPGCSMLSCSS